jgi:hypothetical protein
MVLLMLAAMSNAAMKFATGDMEVICRYVFSLSRFTLFGDANTTFLPLSLYILSQVPIRKHT